jgi:hypothetical protein
VIQFFSARVICGDGMERFVEGADRGQSTFLPECLDDWIDENNPVRVIDAFVVRSISPNSGSQEWSRR